MEETTFRESFKDDMHPGDIFALVYRDVAFMQDLSRAQYDEVVTKFKKAWKEVWGAKKPYDPLPECTDTSTQGASASTTVEYTGPVDAIEEVKNLSRELYIQKGYVKNLTWQYKELESANKWLTEKVEKQKTKIDTLQRKIKNVDMKTFSEPEEFEV